MKRALRTELSLLVPIVTSGNLPPPKPKKSTGCGFPGCDDTLKLDDNFWIRIIIFRNYMELQL